MKDPLGWTFFLIFSAQNPFFTTRSPTWVAFAEWFLKKIASATSFSGPTTIHISERIAAAWRC